MTKVLITGGAGFIGSTIVNLLSDIGGYEVTVLDSMTSQIHGKDWENSYLYQSIKDKCTFVLGDVRCLEVVKKAVGDNEVIVHLAAETGTGQSMYQINQYNEVNVMGTSNLFQAIVLNRNNRVRKMILSSSRSVYGEGKYYCCECGEVYPKGRCRQAMLENDFSMYCPKCGKKVTVVPTTEDSPLQPSSLYAFTKVAQEKMFETMCPALNIDYTIFRFQNVYGAGQSLKNPYTGILSVFSSLMLDNKPVNIFENGLESRDFIHVKDIARGVISSFSNKASNGEIINLGSGNGTTVLDIAGYLKERYGSRSELRISGDFRVGDIAHNIADITKAESLLGFEPEISLRNGLVEFCNWVVKQETDNSRYNTSLEEMEKSGMFIRKLN